MHDARHSQVPSCVDDLLLKTMLRDTWHSDAIIQTDCCDSVTSVAQFLRISDNEALTRYVNAGGGAYYGYRGGQFKPAMLAAIAAGNISAATIMAAGTRVLETELRLGFYDIDQPTYPFANASAQLAWSLLDGTAHRALAREAATKTTVLLKNANHTLPLPGPGSRRGGRDGPRLAVIGPFARCGPAGLCYAHDYAGTPSFTNDFAHSITARAAQRGLPPVRYAQGSNDTCAPRCDSVGPSHWVPCAPDAIAAAAVAEAVAVAQEADVVVLAVGLGEKVEAEGCDRPNMTLPHSQQVLYDAVASATAMAGAKLVVVIVSAGGVQVDESRADAVLWQPYGGQAAGDGLAAVLFGDASPSARLPQTFYKQAWADKMSGNVSTSILSFDLEVGEGRTHRYLKDPSLATHWFGFGLSYARFAYSNLRVAKQHNGSLSVAVDVQLLQSFWSSGAAAGGAVEAAEIVQAYMSAGTVAGLATPRHNLVGFTRVVFAGAGAGMEGPRVAHVAFQVDPASFQTALGDGTRSVVPGSYTLWVGGHQPGDKEGDAGTSGPCLSAAVSLP